MRLFDLLHATVNKVLKSESLTYTNEMKNEVEDNNLLCQMTNVVSAEVVTAFLSCY